MVEKRILPPRIVERRDMLGEEDVTLWTDRQLILKLGSVQLEMVQRIAALEGAINAIGEMSKVSPTAISEEVHTGMSLAAEELKTSPGIHTIEPATSPDRESIRVLAKRAAQSFMREEKERQRDKSEIDSRQLKRDRRIAIYAAIGLLIAGVLEHLLLAITHHLP